MTTSMSLRRRAVCGFSLAACLAFPRTAEAQTSDAPAADQTAITEQAPAKKRGSAWTDGLKIGADLQFRYHATFEAETTGDDDAFAGGFELARARLKVKAKVPDTNLSLRLITNINRAAGTVRIDDAFIDWKLDDHWSLRFGQFKLPFTHEFFTAIPPSTLFADRSLADAAFRVGRGQGVQVSYTEDRVRGFLAFSDGRKSKYTNFNNDKEADAAVSGRLEARLGDASWKQYRTMSAYKSDKTGVLLGLAGHWQQDGSTTAPASFGDDVQMFSWTGDVSFETSGFSLGVAGFGRLIDGEGAEAIDAGFSVQSGQFLTERLELIERYVHLFPGSDRTGGVDSFGAVSLGFNYYLIPDSHAIRFTAEVTHYWDAQAASSSIISPNTLIGLLADSEGSQTAGILQLQLVF